jgi:Domain of unknown function (DUF4926)
MMNAPMIYDEVRLTTSRFEPAGVGQGSLGYIVECYSDGNYEVEFSDPRSGETIAQVVAGPAELSST